MRKPTICLCENKDADQLRGNREADQRLCFRYTDSTVPLLLKSKISSLLPSSVLVQPGLCRTWSETQIVGFLTHRLIFCRMPIQIKPRPASGTSLIHLSSFNTNELSYFCSLEPLTTKSVSHFLH